MSEGFALNTPTVAVNDIHTGIQWLGRYAGTPAVFVTLQGCDVRCAWCNVPETWSLVSDPLPKPRWSKEFKRPVTRWLTLTAGEIVDSCAKYKQQHVVITGGEPLLHDLSTIVSKFLSQGFVLQLETSGTKAVDGLDPKVWLSVSPKIQKSLNMGALSRADEIIYPMTSMDSLKELQQKVSPHLKPSTPVYLHPIGSTRLESQALDASFKYNYLLTTHKALSA